MKSSKKGGANLVLIAVIIIFLLIVVFIRNINKQRSLSPELPSTTVPLDQGQESEDGLDLEIGEIEDIEKELQDLESELQGL